MARFLKTYKIILWIVLVLLVLPLIVPCFYNRPTRDDINQLMAVDSMQADTIFSVFTGAAKSAYNFWISITGTFSLMIHFFLLWRVFGNALLIIYPMFTLLLLLISCFHMARCLRAVRMDIPSDVVTCLALLLGIMYVLFFPDAYEGVYWVAGAAYTVAFAVTVCAFSGIFMKLLQSRSASFANILYIIGLSLLFFFIGGGDHINATFSVAVYAILSLWVVLSKKQKRYLVPFLFLIAGYLLAVLAPGNANREGAVSQSQIALVLAFAKSYFRAGKLFFQDIRYWLFLILCAPVAAQAAKAFRFTLKQIVVVAVVSLSLLAACIFPIEWASYGTALRHVDRFFFTLCPLMILNLICILGYLQRYIRPSNSAADSEKTLLIPVKHIAFGMCVSALAILLMSATSQPETPYKFTSCPIPSAKAVLFMYNGKLKRYAEDYDKIVAVLREHPNETVEAYCPFNSLLGSPYLTDDPMEWTNDGFARYYGGEKSRIRCYAYLQSEE